MAWERKTLGLIAEVKDRDGKLKHRWEISRQTNEAEDKKFARDLTQTREYVKDGQKKTFSFHLTKQDLNWIRDNWDKIAMAMDPPPAAAAPSQGEIEEVPF